MADLTNVKPGDQIRRWLGGMIPMLLTVTSTDETTVTCGDEYGWTFDRQTGAEIDEDLGWGAPPRDTGSYAERVDD